MGVVPSIKRVVLASHDQSDPLALCSILALPLVVGFATIAEGVGKNYKQKDE